MYSLFVSSTLKKRRKPNIRMAEKHSADQLDEDLNSSKYGESFPKTQSSQNKSDSLASSDESADKKLNKQQTLNEEQPAGIDFPTSLCHGPSSEPVKPLSNINAEGAESVEQGIYSIHYSELSKEEYYSSYSTEHSIKTFISRQGMEAKNFEESSDPTDSEKYDETIVEQETELKESKACVGPVRSDPKLIEGSSGSAESSEVKDTKKKSAEESSGSTGTFCDDLQKLQLEDSSDSSNGKGSSFRRSLLQDHQGYFEILKTIESKNCPYKEPDQIIITDEDELEEVISKTLISLKLEQMMAESTAKNIELSEEPERDEDFSLEDANQVIITDEGEVEYPDLSESFEELSSKQILMDESVSESIVLSVECETGLTQDDFLMEEAEDLVREDEATASVKEVQVESKKKLYPVPWASIKTVGFLFSLIKSDSNVFLSPREAATTINKHVLLSFHQDYKRRLLEKMEAVANMKKLLTDGLVLVNGRMDAVRPYFVEECEDDRVDDRKVVLERRMYLRQAAQDVSFLIGRMEQYVFERSNLLLELDRFLRTPIPLFPAYKDL